MSRTILELIKEAKELQGLTRCGNWYEETQKIVDELAEQNSVVPSIPTIPSPPEPKRGNDMEKFERDKYSDLIIRHLEVGSVITVRAYYGLDLISVPNNYLITDLQCPQLQGEWCNSRCALFGLHFDDLGQPELIVGCGRYKNMVYTNVVIAEELIASIVKTEEARINRDGGGYSV